MNSFLRMKWIALLFAGSCCALAQAASGPALGSVMELKEPCQTGPGPIAGTTCRQLRVSCAGVKPILAQIRITEPAAGVPIRGTVVMGSGGGGAGFYGGEGGRILVGDVAAMGFRVVDRSWDGEVGWISEEGGLRKQSCRYATLLTW